MSDNHGTLLAGPVYFQGDASAYKTQVYATDKEGEYKVVANISTREKDWGVTALEYGTSTRLEAMCIATAAITDYLQRNLGQPVKKTNKENVITLEFNIASSKNPEQLASDINTAMVIGSTLGGDQYKREKPPREALQQSMQPPPVDIPVVGKFSEQLRGQRGGSKNINL